MVSKIPSIVVLVLLTLWCGALVPDLAARPLAVHNLSYSDPATTWDEAMPLGNGLLGALVWGDGHPLRISLDRTDLWDLRPVPEFHTPEYSYATMRQWVAERRIDDLHRLYDDPYGHPGPTKIPAGRIELSLELTWLFGRRSSIWPALLRWCALPRAGRRKFSCMRRSP